MHTQLPAPGKPADFDDFVLGRRFRLFQQYVPTLESPRVLDFGAGTGGMTHYFAPIAGRLDATDINEEYLATLKRSHLGSTTQERIFTHVADASALPFEEASFDLIVSFEVLEHLPDERGAIAELYRVLKPGGHLFFTVPNKWWIFETHGARLPLLPWNRVPFFGWLPKALHDKYALARNYTIPEIHALFTERGFVMHKIGYMTAPMDVLKKYPNFQRWVRGALFSVDETSIPMLSTALFFHAQKPV